MKLALRSIAVLFLFASALPAETWETTSFPVTLSATNAVPPPPYVTSWSWPTAVSVIVQRNNAGQIISGVVNCDINYDLVWDYGATITGLSIRRGNAGTNGPGVIDSGISPSNPVEILSLTGKLFRQFIVDDGALLADILASPSGYYLHLGFAGDPLGGGLRDQLAAGGRIGPTPSVTGVVNNASFATSPATVAPGSIAAVYGSNLNDGSSVLSAQYGSDGKLTTSLGGASATVGNIAAPLFYSTPGQLGVQIPFELAGQTSATIVVTVGNRVSLPLAIAIDAFAPGIFTVNSQGSGLAAVLHQDGITPVTTQNPAHPNEIVTFYLTGLGAVTPALATGAKSVGNRTVETPTVTIDGVGTIPDFSGAAPGFAGLNQVNVRIPASTRTSSSIPVVVTIGGRQSNAVTIPVSQ